MPSTVDVARSHGIVLPVVAWATSKATGVPFPVLCAFLMQETAGGRNIFGHDGGDDGWYSGAGEVTEAKYRAYKAGRASHMAQGVGPLQLTWPPFQDQADAAGGCWRPAVNVRVGAEILADLHRTHHTWHAAAAAWNGSDAYADQIVDRINQWQGWLAGATDPGGTPMPDIYAPVPYFGYRYSDGRPMRTCTRDLQALELLRADLHARFPSDYSNPLYIFQGCYNDGSLSAGTHLGSSVYDLHPSDYQAKAELGARHGIIVFHRPPNWDGKGGGEHLHCIIRGGQKMNPAAHDQVDDWDRHLDGLAGHSHYDGPWYPVKPFVYHQPHDPPQRPPHQPPPMSLLEQWQHDQGDAIRAQDRSIATGKKLVAAQPNRPILRGILEDEEAARADASQRWRITHEAAT